MAPEHTTNFSNTWEGVTAAAKKAGAKFPELVAGQWALESGWGKHTPAGATNNFFGLKGDNDTASETKEFVGGKWITIKAEFLAFSDLFSCVDYLVSRWYKDFKGYKGVNHCVSIEDAAKELYRQSYATDPDYPAKLLKIVREQAGKAKPAAKAASAKPELFELEALQDTWLKKEPKDATELGDGEKLAVQQGKKYAVIAYSELAQTAHARVELAFGAGEWCVYEPHWKRVQKGGEAVKAAVDWTNFNCLVTPNLTVGEVLQWDARRRPAKGSAVEKRIIETAQEFEKIRAAWGAPMGVTSFYRPEPINSQVGGVPNSRHTKGMAMDVYPVGRTLESFYQWIRMRWAGGLGDGRNRGFIHLDTEGGKFVPGARPSAEWIY